MKTIVMDKSALIAMPEPPLRKPASDFDLYLTQTLIGRRAFSDPGVGG